LLQPQAWVDRQPNSTMYPARVRIWNDRMEGSVNVPGCAFMTIKRSDNGPITPLRTTAKIVDRVIGPAPLTFDNTPVIPAEACREKFLSRGRNWPQVIDGLNSWADQPGFYDRYIRVMQVGLAEKRYRNVLACRDTIKADTGRDLVNNATLDDWNNRLLSSAQLFFSRHRQMIENDLAAGSADGSLMDSFAESRTLSTFGGRALTIGRATQQARIDAAEAAKLAAAKLAADRAAAIAALVPAFGPWRKTNTFEYTRQAPGGITASLFCDTADGLGIAFSIADGYFINPTQTPHNPVTDLTLTTGARQRSFQARLVSTGTTTTTGYDAGREVNITTTSYDPRQASFGMNVPARRGDAAKQMFEAAGQGGAAFAKALGARPVAADEDPMLLVLRASGQLTSVAMEANTINFADIATVRNEDSLKLAIHVFGRGMVDLFDLEPKRPPFSALLKACTL
jgi:hypothetical protein